MFMSMVEFCIMFSISYTLIKVCINTCNLVIDKIQEEYYLWKVRGQIQTAINEFKTSWKYRKIIECNTI